MQQNIILYDPSIGSMNEGDKIIVDSAFRHLCEMFPYSSYTRLPTQMPVSHRVLKWFEDVDIRIVCGTNLLKYGMIYEKGRYLIHLKNVRQWDLGLNSISKVGPIILLGCGWKTYQGKPDHLSKSLWKNVLDKKYVHSVRDNYTKIQLERMGIDNVIVTGCPTLWGFNPSFCAKIPVDKQENVITTITNYRPDVKSDNLMLRILAKQYRTVYLWNQGHRDSNYVKSLDLPNNVELLLGGLEAFDKVLSSDKSIEYVGTRLHGGIRALQHKRRSTIISVDNRAIEMGRDFHLNIFSREDILSLDDYLNKSHRCEIIIPSENIGLFKEQFSNL